MEQAELRLSEEDRRSVEMFRSKGLCRAREATRAHILACLDRGIAQTQVMAVLGVTRTVIWRTRAAYLEGGLEYALHDAPRPGQPRVYDTDVEARITALACSAPPAGAKRWTLALLQQAVQAQIRPISRESLRLLLKKTASNRGAD